MGKKISAFLMAFFGFAITMFGQATSLEIDNAVPGWLYKSFDGTNVNNIESLVISGYLNSTDIKYLGQNVIEQHAGDTIQKVDLTNVVLVGEGSVKDNELPERAFGYVSKTVKHLLMPISIENSAGCLTSFSRADTLTLGGGDKVDMCIFYNNTSSGTAAPNYYNIIFRDGTQEVFSSKTMFSSSSGGHYSNIFGKNLTNLTFPRKMRSITVHRSYDWRESPYEQYHTSAYEYYNNNSVTVVLPDTLERLSGNLMLQNAEKALYIPHGVHNLDPSCIFSDRAGSIIYFSESVDSVELYTVKGHTSSLHSGYLDGYIWHVPKVEPPLFVYSGSMCEYKILDACINTKLTVFVPKGAKQNYEIAPGWKNATILEETCPIIGITIDQHQAKLLKGDELFLYTSITPSNADNPNYTWKSSNQAVASVSNGIVFGKSSGKTYIYAISDENPEVKDSCEVTVYQPVTTLLLDKHGTTLKVGEEQTIRATVLPEDADDMSVSWSTENEDIVTVNNGKISSNKAGTAYVFAVSNYDVTKRDSCLVTVTQPVTGIVLSPEGLVFSEIGVTQQIVATVLPEDASNKNVNWTSSNNAVCMVSPNGEVVSTGNGNAIIMASTADGGFMALCNVTVDNVDYVGNFRLTHAAILSKTIDTVTPDDLAAIEAALADYEQLPESAKEALAAEKALLDALKAKVEEILSGISSVYTGGNANNHLYNIAGQAVNDSFRGIVIINGRKVYMK